MRELVGIKSLEREFYTRKMAENLPLLRTKMGLSQTEFAGLIGVTRQTVSAVENRSRPLTWTSFLSILFLCMQDDETRPLLRALGIYTEELAQAFGIADLDRLSS